MMTENVKTEKINIICNVCGKTFTTNIGWAAKKGNTLVCSKCSSNKIDIEGLSVNDAIKALKKAGLKIE